MNNLPSWKFSKYFPINLNKKNVLPRQRLYCSCRIRAMVKRIALWYKYEGIFAIFESTNSYTIQMYWKQKNKWQASGIKNTRSSKENKYIEMKRKARELCKKVKANNCRYSGQYLLIQWTNKRISLDEFQWCYCTLSQLQGFVGSSFSKTTDYTLNVVAHVQDQIPSAPNHWTFAGIFLFFFQCN